MAIGEVVPNVTDDTFDAEVIGSQQPVIVDFWTPDCRVCKKLEPMLIKFAQASGVKVVGMNALDNPKTVSRYGVMGAPTLLLFAGGEFKGRKTGFLTVRQLESWVASAT